MGNEQELKRQFNTKFKVLWAMITLLYLLELALFATIIVLEFKIGLLH